MMTIIPHYPAGAGVTAAILAGGLARRMNGVDKETLRLGESVRAEEIGPEELAAYDPHGLMFVNVNTPHEYERAKDLLDRVPGNEAAASDPITDAASRLPAEGETPPHTT
jgi:hypothetical protein